MLERGRRALAQACTVASLAALAITPCHQTGNSSSASRSSWAPTSGTRAVTPSHRPASIADQVIKLIDPTLRRGVRQATPRTALAALPPVSATLETPAAPFATLRTDVRIRFDAPVDHALVESLFRLEPQTEGRLDWLDKQVLRFRPRRLAFGTSYVVEVRAGGRAMWSWRFTTIKPITITIDDCADTAEQLHAVLDVLAQRHITAIMFPTGFCQRRFPWLVPAMLAAGHRVCNHTDWHRHLTRLSDIEVAAEIRNGVHTSCDLLRPPYGEWDARIERIAAAQGFRIYMWDVDTYDWGGVSTDTILQRIYSRGGVILMHFHGRGTVEALRRLDLHT